MLCPAPSRTKMLHTEHKPHNEVRTKHALSETPDFSELESPLRLPGLGALAAFGHLLEKASTEIANKTSAPVDFSDLQLPVSSRMSFA